MMKRFLEETNGFHVDPFLIVFPQFVEKDGCVFLKSQLDHHPMDASNFYDKTEAETFVNHVHIDDYMADYIDNPYQSLCFSLGLMEVWAARLKMEYPSYHFALILTFDEDSCVLRLHKRRPDEVPWINEPSLDDYQEGIAVQHI